MKKERKHLALPVAALLMGVLLAGCGKAEPDPNSGVYEGTKATMMGITMEISEVYENGVSFDIRDGGKCVCNLDGETAKLKWTRDGNSIHFEGGGVDLNGTIGGGDLLIENMMDMGIDLQLHCDDLLHADLESEGGSDNSSGSVLKRLKDAKEGKDVYGGSGSTASASPSNDDINDTEQDSGEVNSGEDGDAMSLVNPDYKNVKGDTYEIEGIRLLQPSGWNCFEESDNSVRMMVGATSKDDYLSKSSAVIEWHPNASGSIDTSNYGEPTDVYADFGDLHYKGASGSIPGGWFGLMMIAEHNDGYILVTVTAPSDDSSIDVTSPEFSAILASVETK